MSAPAMIGAKPAPPYRTRNKAKGNAKSRESLKFFAPFAFFSPTFAFPFSFMTILEQNQRFSQSILWQLQRQFFEQQGVAAWQQSIVPQYITSNPFIAKSYAQLVFAWLRDMVAASALDVSQPVYIVELGAGSGRLAYHFLQKFYDFFEQSVLRKIKLIYVMTDFSPRTVDFWQSHPQLQLWVQAGRLDFALFDAEHDTTLTLIHGGQTLSAETLVNPVVFLANYFFDGLTQDVFYIDEKRLHESLVTLTTPQTQPNLHDPDLLNGVTISYEHRLITGDYYPEADFNEMLGYYQDTLLQSYLLFPIGSLRCFQRLQKLTQGRFIIISADKGYHREDDLFFRGEPGLAKHGSFSMMVNYHALGQYITKQGGQFLATDYPHTNLDVCVSLLGQQNYAETRQAYQFAIEQGGPDEFFILKKGLENYHDKLELPQILAYLRLSGWDSQLFLTCFETLRNKLGDITPRLKEQLHDAVPQIWQNYYHLGEADDVPFFLGMLLYGLDYNSEAIAYLKLSLKFYGPDVRTLYNLGLCYYDLRDFKTALAYMQQTLALEADFEPAQVMRGKVEKQLHLLKK